MCTSVDRVWDKLKVAAMGYSQRGSRPSKREAGFLVARLVSEARCDPAPPQDAVEFFVDELFRMIDQASPARRTSA